MARATPVGVEATGKKVFVWAVLWPGWCRSGRTQEAALEALADYLPRYAKVARRAGGRDRDTMLAHVVDAEASYARKLGVRHKAAMAAAVRGPADGVARARPRLGDAGQAAVTRSFPAPAWHARLWGTGGGYRLLLVGD